MAFPIHLFTYLSIVFKICPAFSNLISIELPEIHYTTALGLP